jgi:hypothetical protein
LGLQLHIISLQKGHVQPLIERIVQRLGEMAKQSWPPHPSLFRPFLHAHLPPNRVSFSSLGEKEIR